MFPQLAQLAKTGEPLEALTLTLDEINEFDLWQSLGEPRLWAMEGVEKSVTIRRIPSGSNGAVDMQFSLLGAPNQQTRCSPLKQIDSGALHRVAFLWLVLSIVTGIPKKFGSGFLKYAYSTMYMFHTRVFCQTNMFSLRMDLVPAPADAGALTVVEVRFHFPTPEVRCESGSKAEFSFSRYHITGTSIIQY